MAQKIPHDAPPCPLTMAAVRTSATSMSCVCRARCTMAQALACLYHNTLEILSRDQLNPGQALDLLRPLAVVVSHHKSREGQRDCAAFAATLASGDHAGALAACQRMIEAEEARCAESQGEPPNTAITRDSV